MIKYLKALILLILTTAVLQAQISIAVIDFLGKGVSETDASIITDRFRNSLVNLDSLKVFEREIVNKVLQEQGLQQTGLISDKSAVEFGKMIGVKHIVSGSVSNLNGTYTITAKVIDVQTGEILKSTSRDHQGSLDGLLKQTDILAHQLFGNVRREDRTLSKSNSKIQDYTPIQISFIHPIQIFPELKPVRGLSVNLIYGRKKSVYGLDVGIGNKTNQKMYGIQAGLVNKSKKVIGIQAGLVNMAETLCGLQIGLINKNYSGPFLFLPFVNFGISF